MQLSGAHKATQKKVARRSGMDLKQAKDALADPLRGALDDPLAATGLESERTPERSKVTVSLDTKERGEEWVNLADVSDLTGQDAENAIAPGEAKRDWNLDRADDRRAFWAWAAEALRAGQSADQINAVIKHYNDRGGFDGDMILPFQHRDQGIQMERHWAIGPMQRHLDEEEEEEEDKIADPVAARAAKAARAKRARAKRPRTRKPTSGAGSTEPG